MTETFSSRNRLDREFANESDRGCAILSLCLLERSLAELFGAFLPGGDNDARHFMPKGRLSQGIANARKLGLLTDGNVANFRLLLEIRNTFAHEVLSNISFQSDLIRAKVARLELPDLGAVPDLVEELNKDPRRRFMITVDSLVFTLDWIAGSISRLKYQDVPTWRITKVQSTASG